MTEYKHGEVAWGDNGYSERQKEKEIYLKLTPGSNLVRIITLPYQFYQHRYKMENEKGFGSRYMCSGAHGKCPLCSLQDKPKRRWLVGVIDKKTSSYKVLDIGWSVYKEILGYSDDADWGDPSQYDIDIVVNPKAPPISYYSTVPKPKKPLNANELILKDQVNTKFLVDRTTPPTPEKAFELFEKRKKQVMAENAQSNYQGNQNNSNNSNNGNNAHSSNSAPSVSKMPPASVDEDSDFPDFDSDAGF